MDRIKPYLDADLCDEEKSASDRDSVNTNTSQDLEDLEDLADVGVKAPNSEDNATQFVVSVTSTLDAHKENIPPPPPLEPREPREPRDRLESIVSQALSEFNEYSKLVLKKRSPERSPENSPTKSKDVFVSSNKQFVFDEERNEYRPASPAITENVVSMENVENQTSPVKGLMAIDERQTKKIKI
jgi:hypothetical protein